MKNFFFLLLFLSVGFAASAQQKKPQSKTTSYAAKVKPPKLMTIWGGIKDSVGLSPEAAADLFSRNLNVSDGTNQYKISSFRLFYKQQTVTELEDGTVKPTTANFTELFVSYPVPNIWKESISEKLKKGDELMLLEVIVKDKQGRPMYAPNVKISII